MRKSLAEYLALDYPLILTADPDGGYVFEYPDLSGCLGQIESLDELPAHAIEARTLWLEVAFARGMEIPLPSYPPDYSGKFVIRMPKSLHRTLAEQAAAEGVSLNQYTLSLLAAGHPLRQLERRLDELCAKATRRAIESRLTSATDLAARP